MESFSQITSATGLRYRREVPRSPLRTSAAQERYRSAGGRSTPQYPLSRSTCSGLMAPRAACPTLVWRGSTGETERRTKARMLTRATRRAMRAVWKARSPQTVFPAPCPVLPLRCALRPTPMSTGPHYLRWTSHGRGDGASAPPPGARPSPSTDGRCSPARSREDPPPG